MTDASPRARALRLLEIARDAGAGREALRIIETGRLHQDGDSTVNWPRAVLELEALVRSLPIEFRTALWDEVGDEGEGREPPQSASGSQSVG